MTNPLCKFAKGLLYKYLYILYLPVYWLFAKTFKYLISFLKMSATEKSSGSRKRTRMDSFNTIMLFLINKLCLLSGIQDKETVLLSTYFKRGEPSPCLFFILNVN